MKSIKRIFVANRGEICRRIGQTASRMNIETVMISDRKTLPEFLAPVISNFIYVPEANAKTYLDIEGMIHAARELGADAVHPGYGFLSENAGFARAVEAAGMTWIGPHAEAIEKMASKARAREIAVAAGVPCLPALEGIDVSKESRLSEKLEKFAAEQGFPLLIKAAFGGGGKGMRLVHNKSELLTAAERAASEAINAFGNGLIIVEPYVMAPRHVEVQILGDRYGHIKAIGDRDCSVQRRHQKIIEESPAPGLTTATRKAMAAAAIDVSKRVGYDSTGTIEFLVDWSPKWQNAELQKFYFLEMNTRLQVEHPVTEQVHNVDLVAAQIRVAEGAKLSVIPIRDEVENHSVEIRVYAEDCENNFLPSPGSIHYFKPHQEAGLRWEPGVDTVDEVSANFDPMIAKLVATAATRSEALQLLINAIERTSLIGPKNNLTYLREIFRASPFREGAVTTGFIGENQTTLLAGIRAEKAELEKIIGPGLDQLSNTVRPANQQNQHANLLETRTREIFGSSKQESKLSIVRLGAIRQHLGRGKHNTVNGQAWMTGIHGPISLDFAVTAGIDGTFSSFSYLSHTFEKVVQRQVAASGSIKAHGSELVSPMPGKVVAILAKPGDPIAEFQTIFVLESMKMEFEVKANRAGSLKKILVSEKQQVDSGTILAAWE